MIKNETKIDELFEGEMHLKYAIINDNIFKDILNYRKNNFSNNINNISCNKNFSIEGLTKNMILLNVKHAIIKFTLYQI